MIDGFDGGDDDDCNKMVHTGLITFLPLKTGMNVNR